jgi:UDP-N-acetylglucosamine 4-epimerase
MKATDGVDYVCHEAAWGSVPRSIEMPLLYEEINIRGTLNMMEASRQNGVRRFVYACSSSVYGDSTRLPKRESEEGNGNLVIGVGDWVLGVNRLQFVTT